MVDQPRGVSLSETFRGPTGPTGPRALRGYTGPTGPGTVSESFYYSDLTDYPLTNIEVTEPHGAPGQYRPHWARTTPPASLTANLIGGTYRLCVYCEFVTTQIHTQVALARLYDATLGETLAQAQYIGHSTSKPNSGQAIIPAYDLTLNSGIVGHEICTFSPIAIQELDAGVHVWSLEFTTIPDQIPPLSNQLLRIRGQKLTALKIG